MNSFEIIFYKTANDICPVKEFLLSTDIKTRALNLCPSSNALRKRYKDGTTSFVVI